MASASSLWNTTITWGHPTNERIARSHALFQNFFPGWEAALQQILHNDCQEYLAHYQDPKDMSREAVYEVVECLLQQFPQFRQIEMNIASVILGLTPTILQVLGVTTVQTSLLSLRRPLLTFILSVGSPAVVPLRSHHHISVIEEIFPDARQRPSDLPAQNRRDPGLVGWLSTIRPFVASLLVHACTLGAVANNCYLAYQLGYWAICMFAVGDVWLPMLWIFLAPIVHIVGVVSLHLSISVHYIKNNIKPAKAIRSSKSIGMRVFTEWFSEEGMHSHDSQAISLIVREKSPAQRWRSALLSFVNWLLYVGTAAHVGFGSVVLASLVFIDVSDSVEILGRYLVSTVVCRLVLVYELSRMEDIGVSLRGTTRRPDGTTQS